MKVLQQINSSRMYRTETGHRMKHRFGMLVRASLKAGKLQMTFYGLFVIISAVLFNCLLGVLLPMRQNLRQKIYNHISNRELMLSFPAGTDAAWIEEQLKPIRDMEHVVSVYRRPDEIEVMDPTGKWLTGLKLSFLHNGYEAAALSGRLITEDEKNVAMVPEVMHLFDSNDKKFHSVEGESLIGSNLHVTDTYGESYSLLVVGTFSTADPFLSDKEILVPQKELLRYKDALLDKWDKTHKMEYNPHISFSEEEQFIVEVDSYRSTEKVLEKLPPQTGAYQPQRLFDAASCQTAVFLLYTALVIFMGMTYAGFYLFFKSVAGRRMPELALYTSMGYPAAALGEILLTEYIPLGSLFLLVSHPVTHLVKKRLADPILTELFGDSIMELQMEVHPFLSFLTALCLLCLLLVICWNVLKRFAQIDLTVLLRER